MMDTIDDRAREYVLSVVGTPPEEDDRALEVMFAFIAGAASEHRLYHAALEESRTREGVAMRLIQSLKQENRELKKKCGYDKEVDHNTY